MKLEQGSYYGPKTIVNDDATPVAISKFSFRVGDRVYPFDIISGFEIVTITPNRIPGILLLILGASLVSVGFLQTNSIPSLQAFEITVPPFEWLVSFGSFLCIAGLGAMLLVSKRYALRITLEMYEVDAIISRRKGYIDTIARDLNKELSKFQCVSMPVPDQSEHSRKYRRKQQA